MYVVDFKRVMVGRQGALPEALRSAQVIKTTPAPARLVFFACCWAVFLLAFTCNVDDVDECFPVPLREQESHSNSKRDPACYSLRFNHSCARRALSYTTLNSIFY